jgi:hypothetical protein
MYIDNLHSRLETHQVLSTVSLNLGNVHPGKVPQADSTNVSYSEPDRQDSILRNWLPILLESEGQRKSFPKKSQKQRMKDLAASQTNKVKQVVKNHIMQTEGINPSKLK